MRVRGYEELRETGEHKKRAFRKNIYKIGDLRFEGAFELRTLGLIVCMLLL